VTSTRGGSLGCWGGDYVLPVSKAWERKRPFLRKVDVGGEHTITWRSEERLDATSGGSRPSHVSVLEERKGAKGREEEKDKRDRTKWS